VSESARRDDPAGAAQGGSGDRVAPTPPGGGHPPAQSCQARWRLYPRRGTSRAPKRPGAKAWSKGFTIPCTKVRGPNGARSNLQNSSARFHCAL